MNRITKTLATLGLVGTLAGCERNLEQKTPEQYLKVEKAAFSYHDTKSAAYGATQYAKEAGDWRNAAILYAQAGHPNMVSVMVARERKDLGRMVHFLEKEGDYEKKTRKFPWGRNIANFHYQSASLIAEIIGNNKKAESLYDKIIEIGFVQVGSNIRFVPNGTLKEKREFIKKAVHAAHVDGVYGLRKAS